MNSGRRCPASADWHLAKERRKQDLQLSDYALELTGFETEEIDRLIESLGNEAEGFTEENVAPEVSEDSATRSGDLWVLGPHRLLCGDATESAAVEQASEGGLADMVFTDPPYNVSYGSTPRRKSENRVALMVNDSLGSDFPRFLRTVCANMPAVTKGALYICMALSELHTLQRAFIGAELVRDPLSPSSVLPGS